jgi:hypothetical protein
MAGCEFPFVMATFAAENCASRAEASLWRFTKAASPSSDAVAPVLATIVSDPPAAIVARSSPAKK